MGWIGVDLDGTLAMYDYWRGPEHIGEPIIPMVNRVKKWLSDGIEIKIMTARVCIKNSEIEKSINSWCELHIGQVLELTCSKDYQMLELWDDRCVQVIPNTGIPLKDFIEFKKEGEISEESV